MTIGGVRRQSRTRRWLLAAIAGVTVLLTASLSAALNVGTDSLPSFMKWIENWAWAWGIVAVLTVVLIVLAVAQQRLTEPGQDQGGGGTPTVWQPDAAPTYGGVVIGVSNGPVYTGPVTHHAVAIPTEPERERWLPRRVGVVPSRADCFQPRDVTEELDAVVGARQTAVLFGLGGVGKTQVAAQYAERAWRAGEVDLLVWVAADAREMIVSGYAQAATEIGVAGGQDGDPAAGRLLAWLASTDRRWMVVLDDLTDPDDASELWPPDRPSGRVLVTTRRCESALNTDRRRLIKVEQFTPSEAVAYLTAKHASDPARLAGASALAEDVGYLPIALAQAAAYMRNLDLGCAAYRQRFADRAQRLGKVLPKDVGDEHRDAVAVIWSLSIDLANALDPPGLAEPLLKLASVLDPNGIPQAVFTTMATRNWLSARRGNPVSEADAGDGLYCLRRLSLINVDDDIVRVHALVQRATREKFGPDRNGVLAAAGAALEEAWDTAESLDWTVLSMLVKVSEEARDEQNKREVFGRLLDMVDRKRFGAAAMARAWDATYVIQDNFHVLLPLVLECLGGEIAAPVEAFDAPRASQLGAHPRITQQAASTLAFCFTVLDDWRAADPTVAIPLLRAGLTRWELRKRFVEALAKYEDPKALDAILTFARDDLQTGADPLALGAVAIALGKLGQLFGPSERAACVEVLAEIAALAGPHRKTARAAIRSKNELTGEAETVPDIDEAEIITYLNPLSDRGNSSDWADVKEYADHAYNHLAVSNPSPELVTALLDTFTRHPDTVARTAVAKCLGRLNDPRALAVLHAELGQPSLSGHLRQACVDALAAR